MQYFSGELSATDKEKTDQWVSASPENKKTFEEVRTIFEAFEASKQTKKYDAEKAWIDFDIWLEMQKRSERTVKIRKLRTEILKYAAIVIFAVSLGIGVSYFRTAEHTELQELTFNVPYGHRSSVTLGDGTKVQLNSGSEIQVVLGHSNKRSLKLSGEAWFEVAHDPQRPFVVETERFSVAVLGTSFNIKSYPEDIKSHFYLSEGSVQLSNRLGEGLLLQPRQYVSVTDDMGFSQIMEPLEHSVTSWRDGKYYFRQETLGEIAKLIRRAYGLKVEFEDPQIALERYTGSLNVDDHVSDFMKKLVLTSGFPMDYKILENKILISSN